VGQALTAATAERAALALAQREAERQAASHRDAAEEVKRSLAELRRRLTAESEALLARSRELWQSVQREARRREKSKADADALRTEMDGLEKGAQALDAAATPAALGMPERVSEPAPLVLAPGSRVRVTDLGFEATLVHGPDAEGRVELRRGSITIRSHVSRLAAPEAAPDAGTSRRHARPGEPRRSGPAVRTELSDEAPPLETDLRGLDAGEALERVDQALDRAVIVGLSEVRLIHGIGTGALRTAVRAHLKSHPQVESQRQGEGHEGGRGVTVARLK
jgi:DNA mismatch repair protein MutS2